MVQQMVLVMFPKYLKRACILQLLGIVFYKCQYHQGWLIMPFTSISWCVLPHLWSFWPLFLQRFFSAPFSLSSISGAPIRCMLICLKMSQRSLRFSSFFYNIFLFFRLDNFYFSSSSLAFHIQSAVRST